MNGFGGLSDLTTAKRGRSRSVNAENPTAKKERAGWRPAIWDLPEKVLRVCETLLPECDDTGGYQRAGRDQSYLDHGSRSDGKGLLCSARSGAADVLG